MVAGHQRQVSNEAGNSELETALEESEFTMVEAEADMDDVALPGALADKSVEIEEKPTRLAPRGDEYDVDFSDTKQFSSYRWNDILRATQERLSPSDQRIAAKYCDWQDLVSNIQGKITNPGSSSAMKRRMSKVQPLPRALSTLTRAFEELVEPLQLKFDLLWGLVYLNLKHSYSSPDRLKRTCDILDRIRRVVALFNRILDALDEPNEALIAVVDFLDPITIILTDSVAYLHEYSSDAKADQAWPELNESITWQMSVLNGIVQHVSEITSYSKVNMERSIKNMSLRHALMPENEESGTFPSRILPPQNSRFYGRSEELEKIHKYLGTKVEDASLRTYTIYGRRGVGKTEIAVQFAYSNESEFDAIFWIQCETSVAIRQSFTNVAISLNLPGAEREGRHEENLLAVQNWLKRTQKRWLLIFDNAEKDQILRAYWPIGAGGSILITSRSYYNYAKDTKRQGETIKPFTTKQSWDLLLQLLGEDWQAMDREGRIPQSESLAAKNMLNRLEGLALAIQQAAILIKAPEIGGPTVAKTYESFKDKIRSLPERHAGPRSSSERALDALWDMTFNSLTANARALLGVLAWLSPDNILIETFLPRNQKALMGPLSFCRQDPIHIKDQERATLASVIIPSLGLDKAIKELLAKELIKQDGRILSIHRVVQEAVNYHDVDELQESFNTASRLVFEQFPKQDGDGSLYDQWSICQNYIHHGVNLSKKYSDSYTGKIKGSEYFVRLLSNCAWYLHELGDYDVSKRVVETGILACDDKTSLLYAQLRNIAGSRYYDTNRLAECRTAWEEVLRIRKLRLPHDDPRIASMYNNLGNLETASGDVDASKDYFERASLIWIAGGDATAGYLALTYLCMGRMHMLKLNLKEAEKMTQLAESLFVRTIGANKGFMAHVHYAYGNIHYRHKQWYLSRRSFEACLRISILDTPIHPITAAAYFSIGCVEHEMRHYDVARAYLEKARAIAELRSPTRDDGTIARITWKTAVVLEEDAFGQSAAEAKELRTRSEVARQALMASGEAGIIPFADDYGVERDPEEDSYDVLVPLFFR